MGTAFYFFIQPDPIQTKYCREKRQYGCRCFPKTLEFSART